METFDGEWLGEQTCVQDDGTVKRLPIGIWLTPGSRAGRYLGNYRLIGQEIDAQVLIPSLRIEGSASGDSLSFVVPSPSANGRGHMVLQSGTLSGELIIPNEPKCTFTVSRD